MISRLTVVAISFVALMIPGLSHQASAQSSDGSRGWDWFIETRPSPPTKTGQRPPKPKPEPKPSSKQPFVTLGLGYSIFKDVPGGRPVRVDPGTKFVGGDRVRVVVETTASAYVYLFVAENGQNPEMIFPDARLDGGDNRVVAHQPLEIPSDRHRLQWFSFSADPATEHVMIVVSTKPLPGVPRGQALVAAYKRTARPWRPKEADWSRFVARSRAESRTAVAEAFGEVQSDEEVEALSRSMTLTTGAPAPSVVVAPAKSGETLVVTKLVLRHE